MSQTIEMPLGPLESWTVRHVAESRLADSADRPFVKIVGGSSEAYGPFILRSAALAHALVAAGARTGHTFGILCGSGLPALHGWMAGALVGAIDVASNEVETPEQVAETLKLATKFVDPERIQACTNCGMAPMTLATAYGKLRALAEGAALARKSL